MTVSAISAGARGRLAERLVPVAMEFAGVVRTEDADGIGEFLRTLTPAERDVLPLVLAAMVDIDRTPQDLLSWITFDESGRPLRPGTEMVLWSPPAPRKAPAVLQPCGTAAAAQRHFKRGERPCDPCRDAWKQQRDARRGVKRQQEEVA